jgi:transaldolase
LLTDINVSLVDEHKLLPLCVAIQSYYKSIKAPTKVLPASLTSTEEIFQLAGIDHLTIAPHLLEQLALPMSFDVKSLFDVASAEPIPAPDTSYLHDYSLYQITFARDRGGTSQVKLTEVCTSVVIRENRLC